MMVIITWTLKMVTLSRTTITIKDLLLSCATPRQTHCRLVCHRSENGRGKNVKEKLGNVDIRKEKKV